jgi:hypothetical protein
VSVTHAIFLFFPSYIHTTNLHDPTTVKNEIQLRSHHRQM